MQPPNLQFQALRAKDLNHHQMEVYENFQVGFVICIEGHCEILKSFTGQMEHYARTELGIDYPNWNQVEIIRQRYDVPRLRNDASNEDIGRVFTQYFGRLEDLK